MALSLTESVVGCRQCGFAALMGTRLREYSSILLGDAKASGVEFAFCTHCGITHAYPFGNRPLSYQPRPLMLRAGTVELAEWCCGGALTKAEETERETDNRLCLLAGFRCAGCDELDTLLRYVHHESAFQSLPCPACGECWLFRTTARAEHR